MNNLVLILLLVASHAHAATREECGQKREEVIQLGVKFLQLQQEQMKYWYSYDPDKIQQARDEFSHTGNRGLLTLIEADQKKYIRYTGEMKLVSSQMQTANGWVFDHCKD